MNKSAIIIGSGFGGLSLGIRLQARGINTTIYEKNEKVGGHAYQFKEKGYTFDMGPSIITEPKIIQSIFNTVGKDMNDYLGLSEVDPFYRIFFHDKTFIDYSSDSKEMKEQLSKFNEDDAKNYDKFMEYAAKLYKIVITDRLGSQPFHTLQSAIGILPKVLSVGGIFPSVMVAKRYFKDFRSQFLFSFHTLFIGGNPFESPSLFLMLPFLEKKERVWFSKGGMYSLVEALEKIFKEAGGKIETNSPVEEIVIEKRKAIGVKVKGTFIPSDIVVSNAHFAHTYKDLIPESKRRFWKDWHIKAKDYSMSCVLLYLGVKKQYKELVHHTLILSKRYKGLIDDIFNKKVLPKDFSMYLHIPSRSDSTMAPKGSDSMYVLVPVPNLSANIDWNVEKDKFTKVILDFLENSFGLTDLQKNIEVLRVFTPVDFQNQRNNYLGAAWSLKPSLLQIATLRPHNVSEEFNNLFLVGASTHPGGGVPGVMLSAEATEKLIVEYFEKYS